MRYVQLYMWCRAREQQRGSLKSDTGTLFQIKVCLLREGEMDGGGEREKKNCLTDTEKRKAMDSCCCCCCCYKANTLVLVWLECESLCSVRLCLLRKERGEEEEEEGEKTRTVRINAPVYLTGAVMSFNERQRISRGSWNTCVFILEEWRYCFQPLQ